MDVQSTPSSSDPLKVVAEVNRRMVLFAEQCIEEDATGYMCFSSILCELTHAIEHAFLCGVQRGDLRAAISETRALVAGSPYVNRIQSWPRGYQGDFETVEMLSGGVQKLELSKFLRFSEYFAQTLPITQQHRNKLNHQERLAREALRKNQNILSVGCGGALDLQRATSEVSGYTGEIWLIDMDSEALALAQSRLEGIQLTVSNRNVVREASRLPKSTFDLIICGGIFDYFEDRVASILLRQLVKSIRPGGQLFLTNIAPDNPYKYMMEYVCDWTLRERDEEAVKQLLKENCSEAVEIVLSRDETGLAILAQAKF